MQKGVAIIERDETKTKAFFIDHEVIEFARLNGQTKKRLAKAEADHRKADREHRKAEKAKARRRAYTIRTVRDVLFCISIIGGVAWGGAVGVIEPVACIPVIGVAACVACVRCGLWFGRMVK